MMYKLALQLRDGHLFVELNNGLYLLDTGAPSSFGTTSRLSIADETFDLQNNYLGLSATTLSQLVGVRCEGLLGADILGRFDHLFDVPWWHAHIFKGRIDLRWQVGGTWTILWASR